MDRVDKKETKGAMVQICIICRKIGTALTSCTYNCGHTLNVHLDCAQKKRVCPICSQLKTTKKPIIAPKPVKPTTTVATIDSETEPFLSVSC